MAAYTAISAPSKSIINGRDKEQTHPLIDATKNMCSHVLPVDICLPKANENLLTDCDVCFCGKFKKLLYMRAYACTVESRNNGPKSS